MTPEKHRKTNTLLILFLSVTVLLVTFAILETRHSMQDCEERLYKKLTKQKYPFSKDEYKIKE